MTFFLLFSNLSMKKAQMSIQFETDTAEGFGYNVSLITTVSGYYAITMINY